MAKNLWLTYAWKDNEDKDIDFIVQELDGTGIGVSFDRRNLIHGQRLWTQIGGAITDPAVCDAWGIVLTANSLRSQPCIEELSYALDRALTSNGAEFPLFALLHKVDFREMPAALRIRLCINLEEPAWKDKVVAATNGVAVGFKPSGLDDYYAYEHARPGGFALEVRPRFDRVSPFKFVVELSEKESGNVINFQVGPAGKLPQGSVVFMATESNGQLDDGTQVWIMGASNEATATTSYFLYYKQRPNRIWAGREDRLRLIIVT